MQVERAAKTGAVVRVAARVVVVAGRRAAAGMEGAWTGRVAGVRGWAAVGQMAVEAPMVVVSREQALWAEVGWAPAPVVRAAEPAAEAWAAAMAAEAMDRAAWAVAGLAAGARVGGGNVGRSRCSQSRTCSSRPSSLVRRRHIHRHSCGQRTHVPYTCRRIALGLLAAGAAAMAVGVARAGAEEAALAAVRVVGVEAVRGGAVRGRADLVSVVAVVVALAAAAAALAAVVAASVAAVAATAGAWVGAEASAGWAAPEGRHPHTRGAADRWPRCCSRP